MPLFAVISANTPLPRFLNKGKVSLSSATKTISGRPSLSRSRASTPIPEIKWPSSVSATPASNELSSNLPPPFIVKVGIVDLVVGDEDIHPAIQVEIRDAYSHALTRMGADSAFRRDIFEGSVALIEE